MSRDSSSPLRVETTGVLKDRQPTMGEAVSPAQSPLVGVTFHIPKDVVAIPANGQCICDSWWSVHPEKGVAFYAGKLTGYYASDEPSPQCNRDEHTARALCKRLHPDHTVEFLPVVFLAHAERVHRMLRANARAELSKLGKA